MSSPRSVWLTRQLTSFAVALLIGVTVFGTSARVDSAVVVAPTTPTPVATKPPAVHQGPFALIIVVDAARYDELDPARMPNLAKLAAQGATYVNAYVGQLPSLTEASHATIGTGVLPKRHLILGDTWRVPGSEQMSPNLLDGNLDRTGYISKLIQQSGSPSLASILHQRWPGSIVVSVSGHKVYAADAMGAGGADFVAFGVNDSRGHFVPGATPGHAPAHGIMLSRQLDLPSYPRTPGLEDQWTTTLAEKFLFKYHPRLMMINLPEVDTIGHLAGTDVTVMQPLLSGVDKQIGRLIAAYGRAGMLPQTDFVITSDHGMTPAVHTIDTGVVQKVIRRAGGQGLYVGHGDYCQVWLKNPEAVPRVAAALSQAKIANVAAVYMRNAGGKYALVSAPSRLAAPSVERAYSDLLGTLNQGESPDIVLVYDENTITMTPTFIKIGRKGDHGGATWGAQHIPLFIAGPGIKPRYTSSYPARLVDIAPTVETLLGARPQRQDGIPLADAMVAPPAAAMSAQLKRGPQLAVDVRAMEYEAALRPNLH
jgi:hypothetical protein